jgi:predicted hotdog family 3-hydroxylacyl-ACP dehydratase
MDEKWFRLRDASLSCGVAELPGDSLFFAGHFPGQAVLPGLALLAMCDRLFRLAGHEITALRRVRFRSIIKSACRLPIKIVPKGTDFSFSVMYAGQKACTGIAAITSQAQPQILAQELVGDRSVPVEDLIPQRKPMRLVDKIIKSDTDGTLTQARVANNWPLFESGRLNPLTLIELAAQSGASHMGYTHRNKGTLEGRGYLVGVKQARFFVKGVQIDSVLTTQTRPLVHHAQYLVFESQVFQGRHQMAEVVYQAYRPTGSGKQLPE